MTGHRTEPLKVSRGTVHVCVSLSKMPWCASHSVDPLRRDDAIVGNIFGVLARRRAMLYIRDFESKIKIADWIKTVLI